MDVAAAVECGISDARNRGRDGHARQSAAAVERRSPDARNAIWDCYARKTAAACKQAIGNSRHRIAVYLGRNGNRARRLGRLGDNRSTISDFVLPLRINGYRIGFLLRHAADIGRVRQIVAAWPRRRRRVRELAYTRSALNLRAVVRDHNRSVRVAADPCGIPRNRQRIDCRRCGNSHRIQQKRLRIFRADVRHRPVRFTLPELDFVMRFNAGDAYDHVGVAYLPEVGLGVP